MGAVVYGSAGASAIDPSDVISRVDASASLANQGWQGLNCYGKFPRLWKIGDSGLTGSALLDGTNTRFGRVADPVDPSRSALVFRVKQDDPLTAGGRRCELVSSPEASTALPRNENFWYAFRLLVWEGLESRGDSALLTQWHEYGYNPFFSVVLRDGKLRATIRYAASDGSAKKVFVQHIWSDPNVAERKWATFVVRAKISDEPGRGYIEIWRDGVKLASRVGALGYGSAGYPYAKIGFYQWMESNYWDSGSPVKTIYVSDVVIIGDGAQKYGLDDVLNYIQSRVGTAK